MKNRISGESFKSEAFAYGLNGHTRDQLVSRAAGLVRENPKSAFMAALAVGLLLGFWLKEKK